MKKSFIILVLLFFLSFSLFSQVGINTDGSDPDESAMLDVKSNNKGLLIPRITEEQRNAISDPELGLTIFQIDNSLGFYYFKGSVWAPVSSKKYSIGDFAQGGIVFWVDETGEHGLVCAKEDQSDGVRWYAGTWGDTRAYGDGPYSGEANTAIIIAAHVAIGDDGNTYAARVCNELQVTEGGKTYGDWYLPSREELILMHDNKHLINAVAIANGGIAFEDIHYWSSTDMSLQGCYAEYFADNYTGNELVKSYPALVRAVRAF